MKKQKNMHQTVRKKSGKRGNGGFTLVELIVVIVIMGILTAAILPTVTGYVASAREQVAESNKHMVEQAAHLYLTNWEMENGNTESATIKASDLVTEGYLSALPKGEEYTVTITRNENGRYAVAVTKDSTSSDAGTDDTGQQE